MGMLAVAVLLAFALGMPNEAQFLSVGVFGRLLACTLDQLGSCTSSVAMLFDHVRIFDRFPQVLLLGLVLVALQLSLRPFGWSSTSNRVLYCPK